jgi:hypothetical protein
MRHRGQILRLREKRTISLFLEACVHNVPGACSQSYTPAASLTRLSSLAACVRAGCTCARRLQSVLHACSQSYTPEQPRCMRKSRLYTGCTGVYDCPVQTGCTPVQPAYTVLHACAALLYTACLTRLFSQHLRMQRVASRHALRTWLVDCSCMLWKAAYTSS